MRYGSIVAAAAALMVTSVQALASPSVSELAGSVEVRIAGANNGKDVTDGGVSGRGRFTATGAVSDRGTVVAHRTVKGSLPGGVIALRFVTNGLRGSITYLVTIDTGSDSSRWRISSATGRYKGLHGHGIERENDAHTVSTLVGTVST
jgi:hypothetical protein